MTPEDANWITELLKGGGNAAIIVLCIIATKVANKFLEKLEAIVTALNNNHAENLSEIEAVKRAIIFKDPEKARFFEKSST